MADIIGSPAATQAYSDSARADQPTLVRGLSLMDSVLLLMGGILGSGIFLTASDIASSVARPSLYLLVWVGGLIFSLLACMAFAELGAMYPEAGGTYVYLREAYGDLIAFLYGWMIFAVMYTGSIAALATGFSEYLGAAYPPLAASRSLLVLGPLDLTCGKLVAVMAIAFLTAINVLGLRHGAILQNVATWANIGALGVFVLLGFLSGKGSTTHFTQAASSASSTGGLAGLGVALIAVIWSYDGWVNLSCTAGEVRDPGRTLPRALILGIVLIGVLYIAMNAVYLYALPLDEIARDRAVAQTAASLLFSPRAGIGMALLVSLVCFGCANSATLSGSRVYYAMSRDGVFLKSLAEVHPRFRTPVFSLVAQGIWSAVLVFSGRYDQLYTYAIFMLTLSYVAGVAALFVLRRQRPEAPRPYRCTGYPWLPGLYVVAGLLWAANTAWQRPRESLAGIGVVLLGIPGFYYWRAKNRA